MDSQNRVGRKRGARSEGRGSSPIAMLSMLGGAEKAPNAIESYRSALAKAFKPAQMRELDGLHALCDLAQLGATVVMEMEGEADE